MIAAQYAGEPTFNDSGTADTRDDFCQVQVRFTFDDEVIGKAPVANRFVLVGFDPTTRYLGQTALVEASGNDVLVRFGRGDNLTTPENERQDVGAAQLLDISLAAVEADAVSDNDVTTDNPTGQENPIGDQPIGDVRTTAKFPAGITAAPDLVDIVLTGSNNTATTVRFDFDETVGSIVKSNGFHVITEQNRDITCGSPFLSGSTVTVTCATATTDPIARGYVESGTVSDGSDGNLNPLHAERVADSSRTLAPDLVAAEFRPGSTEVNNDDRVLFTFDEPVFIGDQTRFVVYQQDTDEVRSISAVRQSDPTQVLATFPDEVTRNAAGLATGRIPALENAVGASVLEGAVIEAGDLNRPNQEDELAVLNAARNTVTPGVTEGPDLVSVTVQTNELMQREAVFTFDEELDPFATTYSRLFLYQADGKAFRCRSGTTEGNSVTCNDVGTTAFAQPPADPVLGTADNGAVEDGGGTPNPEGAVRVSG